MGPSGLLGRATSAPTNVLVQTAQAWLDRAAPTRPEIRTELNQLVGSGNVLHGFDRAHANVKLAKDRGRNERLHRGRRHGDHFRRETSLAQALVRPPAES